MSVVLIVDDEAIVREPLSAALRLAGHQTIIAANAAEALAKISVRPPDVVLLDIAMPVMNGLDALRRIRQSPAAHHLPVIMLTQAADRATIIAAAQLGVSGYLLKSSFALNEVIAQIQRAVSSSAAAASTSRPANSSTTPSPSPANPATGTTQAPPPTVTGLSGPSAAMPANANDLEALRSLRPIMTKTAVLEAIGDCGVAHGFSPAVAEVLTLTGSTRCSIEQVAKAVSRDHAMALTVLRLANSPVYTRGEPVDSVLKAVLRIGLGQIRQTVQNIAIMERFSTGTAGDALDPNQFWEHATATGIIAAELARTRSTTDAETGFTLGLLHDVGRLVLAERVGEAYSTVLQTAQRLQLPLDHVEQRMLGCTHADVMESLFRRWKFAKEFVNPVVFHHLSAGNIRGATPRDTPQIATLTLANRLAHAFMLGSSGNPTISATEDLCDLLRLEARTIGTIEAIAREATDKVKFALLASSNGSNWRPMRDVYRQRLATPMRPLYLSERPSVDACRVFCNELANKTDATIAPNLAVMHLRTVRDVASLTDKLRAAEQEAGVESLPLMALSPAAKIVPDSSRIGPRTVVSLAVPFTIDRFIATVNALKLTK